MTPLQEYNEKFDYKRFDQLAFSLKDLREFYHISYLNNVDRAKSRYDLYLNSLDNLANNLNEFIKLGYFVFSPDLMQKIIYFLVKSKEFDFRGNILSYQNMPKTIDIDFNSIIATDLSNSDFVINNPHIIKNFSALLEQINLAAILVNEIYETKNIKIS